jgi:hypothetical protein
MLDWVKSPTIVDRLRVAQTLLQKTEMTDVEHWVETAQTRWEEPTEKLTIPKESCNIGA